MKRFKNILCVVDPGVENKAALECAVLLSENNQASLTVVAVIEQISIGFGMPDTGPISIDLQTAKASSAARSLKDLVNPFRSRIEIHTKVLIGVQFLEIIREVLGHGYDLVIKALDSPGQMHGFFSSDDMHLLRKCPSPVWLVKPEMRNAPRRILAAIDIDDGVMPTVQESQHVLNRQILEMAGSLALSDFAELHIVHVWRAIGENTLRTTDLRMPEEKVVAYVEQVRRRRKSTMDEVVHEVSSSLGQEAVGFLKPIAHLVKGQARTEIPALAKQINAQLIVMGTVARTGVPGFIIGNTAETILNEIDCSVLAIKPPGFLTPVALEG